MTPTDDRARDASAPRDELRELAAAQCDGTATPEQRDRLQQLLDADPQAVRFYVEYLDLHAELQWQHRGEEAHRADSEDRETAEPQPSTPSLGFLGGTIRRSAGFFSQPTPISISVAAVVVGVLLSAMALMVMPIYRHLAGPADPTEAPTPAVVAQLENVHRAIWAEGQIVTRPGAHLLAGHRIELAEGFVELRYRNGTRVTLSGPCRYVVSRTDAGHLELGELVATVPRQAVGFQVTTEAADFTDLGTQFGVRVSERGQVEAHVVSGHIRAEPKVGDHPEQYELVAGQSLRYDGTWRLVVTAEHDQQRLKSLLRAAETRQIVGVSIHNVSSELTHNQFDRRAIHLLDGSGLSRGAHVQVPDRAVPGGPARGTMWLSNGTFAAPHDPLPAEITFDLGQPHELTGIHVWNYNEQFRRLTSRGAKRVEVLVSPSLNAEDFVRVETASGEFTFPQADGTPTYRGFALPLDEAANPEVLDQVRLVRLVILSTHGENPEEDDANLAGLSEVRFFGRSTDTEPPHPPE